MAIIKVLDKKGSLILHPVVESVQEIYMRLIEGETERNGRLPPYLLLTDEKTHGQVIINSRYIYYVE